MFLFEANKENDIDNTIIVINYLDTFNLKNGNIQGKENLNGS